MKVKIKKLSPLAKIPTYAKPGDAGMDLTAVSREIDENGNMVYKFGLALEIPEGYVGLIFPRSSNTEKTLTMGNSVGVVDSGYRGEICVKFKPTDKIWGGCTPKIDRNGELKLWQVGDRVAQWHSSSSSLILILNLRKHKN